MEIIEIYGEEKRRYMPLLLLADESEEMLGRYLGRGRMFVLLSGGGAAAECVVTDEGGGVLEIKNLAVAPEAQGRGYGRAMLEFVSRRFAGRFHTLLAGTGESPLTVPFYEKCGFVYSHRVRDFLTENYHEPIVEAGVTLRDMVYFKRVISDEKAEAGH